ncbi:MAG: peptidylprolyl isomerase [Deltaproteobacteria bacterium]|nr:peptidylprolyl isomerase [Deltaproteobacteria bacterium]
MTRRWTPAVLLAAAHTGVVGCDDHGGAAGSSAAPAGTTDGAASSGQVADGQPDRLGQILRAELSRQADSIDRNDLSSRDVTLRRAATRALARIGGDAVRARLLRALADEDEEVVAWAAYGLGESCAGQRDRIVSALVAAAAARDGSRKGAKGRGKVSAPRAIVRAVGRCASHRAEAILVGWLRDAGPQFVDAVYALGDLATQRRKLREETFVALLEVAAGNASQAPRVEALYPFGRVEHLPPSVVEHTLEVAKTRLATEGPARQFAVRALTRCDNQAISVLGEIVASPKSYTAAERVAAVRGFSRFGRRGQRALHKLLPSLVPDTTPLAATSLVGANLGVLMTALEGLHSVGRARATLERIAALEAPPEAPVSIRRRLSWLRCTAAQLLAERNYQLPLLRACDLSIPADKQAQDPLPGSIGARAVVAALGLEGVKVRGQRLKAWQTYATEGDLRARQAAIEQLTQHPEIPVAGEVLAKALAAAEPGVVAAAATVIAAQPRRARARTGGKGDAPPPVQRSIETALLAGLEAKGATRDLEALVSVIDAVAALRLEPAKPKLLELCAAPQRVARDHAHKALAELLGGVQKVSCGPPKPLPLPVELDHLATAKVALKLTTDAGEITLELDPDLAPIAVTRVVDLVKAGFYDGMVVHRVVPGFVSQFGSPTADGYGGAKDRPALPCETSPTSFGPLTVGVALAGRDTGSSQLFVTHGAYPHLDGNYAQIGTAKGAWDALIDGDVVQSMKIQSK